MASQDNTYKIYKVISSALSILLAVSIIVLTMTALLLGFCRTTSVLQKSLANHQQEAIDVLNDRLSQIADDTDMPKEVFVNALSPEDTMVIFDSVASNIQYRYTSSFIGDENVYRTFKTGMTDYVQKNHLNISDKQISQNAALAVDTVNEVFGGKSTSSIEVFKISQAQIIMYVVIAAAVLIIGSVVALDLINYGRHRKYSFIGMGLTVAGYILTFASIFVRRMGYIDSYNFCDNSIYNSAISDLITSMMMFASALGMAYLACGVIMLAINYRYFRKRKLQRDEQHKHNTDLRNEYMEQYMEIKGKSGELDDGSVRITGREKPRKIEFDE